MQTPEATNPVQIRWKSHVSFPLSEGRWPSLIRRNRYVQLRGLSKDFVALCGLERWCG